ncbi:hypothetical protein ABZ260_50370 [Streptosporangium sp. NPDC006013]|uniref:hypothetical protein n=1 Tax=Streptosporangium sp. NPDC006013 TaxID=3155596 RepID=UPI0033A49D37
MSTDLGDALTAYWRSGIWWGGPGLIAWMINNGHMSEAAYALDEVLKVPSLPEKQRRALLGQRKRLEALERRAQEKPTLHRPDTPSSEQPGQPPSSTATATSGAPPEPAGDLSP